jgi:methionyl-tRNA synthetase
MLHAVGFPDNQMPQLLVHGWLNLGGAKMSKSAGNIIDPFVLADKYGVDALRYYLMSDVVTGQDADFSEERLIERYNADLANNLGNLLNRTLSMAHRYRDGRLKTVPPESFAEDFNTGYRKLIDDYNRTMMQYSSSLSVHELHRMIESVIGFVSFFNAFIDQQAPWALAKSTSDQDRITLDEVLYDCIEATRIVAILVSPLLPRAAHKIFDQLNWKMELSGKEERFSLADAEWGRLPDGHVVGKPVPLFPRIETTKL